MSLLRTGAYVNGKPEKLDEGPGRAHTTGIGGSLVVGEDVRTPQARYQSTYKAKRAAAREAARAAA